MTSNILLQHALSLIEQGGSHDSALFDAPHAAPLDIPPVRSSSSRTHRASFADSEVATNVPDDPASSEPPPSISNVASSESPSISNPASSEPSSELPSEPPSEPSSEHSSEPPSISEPPKPSTPESDITAPSSQPSSTTNAAAASETSKNNSETPENSSTAIDPSKNNSLTSETSFFLGFKKKEKPKIPNQPSTAGLKENLLSEISSKIFEQPTLEQSSQIASSYPAVVAVPTNIGRTPVTMVKEGAENAGAGSDGVAADSAAGSGDDNTNNASGGNAVNGDANPLNTNYGGPSDARLLPASRVTGMFFPPFKVNKKMVEHLDTAVKQLRVNPNLIGFKKIDSVWDDGGLQNDVQNDTSRSAASYICTDRKTKDECLNEGAFGGKISKEAKEASEIEEHEIKSIERENTEKARIAEATKIARKNKETKTSDLEVNNSTAFPADESAADPDVISSPCIWDEQGGKGCGYRGDLSIDELRGDEAKTISFSRAEQCLAQGKEWRQANKAGERCVEGRRSAYDTWAETNLVPTGWAEAELRRAENDAMVAGADGAGFDRNLRVTAKTTAIGDFVYKRNDNPPPPPIDLSTNPDPRSVADPSSKENRAKPISSLLQTLWTPGVDGLQLLTSYKTMPAVDKALLDSANSNNGVGYGELPWWFGRNKTREAEEMVRGGFADPGKTKVDMMEKVKMEKKEHESEAGSGSGGGSESRVSDEVERNWNRDYSKDENLPGTFQQQKRLLDKTVNGAGEKYIVVGVDEKNDSCLISRAENRFGDTLAEKHCGKMTTRQSCERWDEAGGKNGSVNGKGGPVGEAEEAKKEDDEDDDDDGNNEDEDDGNNDNGDDDEDDDEHAKEDDLNSTLVSGAPGTADSEIGSRQKPNCIWWPPLDLKKTPSYRRRYLRESNGLRKDYYEKMNKEMLQIMAKYDKKDRLWRTRPGTVGDVKKEIEMLKEKNFEKLNSELDKIGLLHSSWKPLGLRAPAEREKVEEQFDVLHDMFLSEWEKSKHFRKWKRASTPEEWGKWEQQTGKKESSKEQSGGEQQGDQQGSGSKKAEGAKEGPKETPKEGPPKKQGKNEKAAFFKWWWRREEIKNREFHQDDGYSRCTIPPTIEQVKCSSLFYKKADCGGPASGTNDGGVKDCLKQCEDVGTDQFGYPRCGGFIFQKEQNRGRLILPRPMKSEVMQSALARAQLSCQTGWPLQRKFRLRPGYSTYFRKACGNFPAYVPRGFGSDEMVGEDGNSTTTGNTTGNTPGNTSTAPESQAPQKLTVDDMSLGNRKFLRGNTQEFELDFGQSAEMDGTTNGKLSLEDRSEIEEKLTPGIESHKQSLYLMKSGDPVNENDPTIVPIDFVNPNPGRILDGLIENLDELGEEISRMPHPMAVKRWLTQCKYDISHADLVGGNGDGNGGDDNAVEVGAAEEVGKDGESGNGSGSGNGNSNDQSGSHGSSEGNANTGGKEETVQTDEQVAGNLHPDAFDLKPLVRNLEYYQDERIKDPDWISMSQQEQEASNGPLQDERLAAEAAGSLIHPGHVVMAPKGSAESVNVGGGGDGSSQMLLGVVKLEGKNGSSARNTLNLSEGLLGGEKDGESSSNRNRTKFGFGEPISAMIEKQGGNIDDQIKEPASTISKETSPIIPKETSPGIPKPLTATAFVQKTSRPASHTNHLHPSNSNLKTSFTSPYTNPIALLHAQRAHQRHVFDMTYPQKTGKVPKEILPTDRDTDDGSSSESRVQNHNDSQPNNNHLSKEDKIQYGLEGANALEMLTEGLKPIKRLFDVLTGTVNVHGEEIDHTAIAKKQSSNNANSDLSHASAGGGNNVESSFTLGSNGKLKSEELQQKLKVDPSSMAGRIHQLASFFPGNAIPKGMITESDVGTIVQEAFREALSEQMESHPRVKRAIHNHDGGQLQGWLDGLMGEGETGGQKSGGKKSSNVGKGGKDGGGGKGNAAESTFSVKAMLHEWIGERRASRREKSGMRNKTSELSNKTSEMSKTSELDNRVNDGHDDDADIL